jgi:heat shock protein HtpX
MNYLKTTVLLGFLTGILVVMGSYIGGSQGALLMLILAGAMNFAAFWFSDKIVLMMYRAKEVGPQDAPELYRVVEKVASKSNIPMPKVFIIPENAPNAFATGRSPYHASVAATAGILQLLSEDELEGVMSHELAHVRNRDTLISTIAATIAGAITWAAQSLQWGAMFGGFGGRDNNDRGGNMLGALLMAILAPIAAMIIQLMISRGREYAADETGARLCGKPLALASALQKLQAYSGRIPMQAATPATSHMFIVNPFRGGFSSLFSTHPPMEERIRRLQELAREIA